MSQTGESQATEQDPPIYYHHIIIILFLFSHSPSLPLLGVLQRKHCGESVEKATNVTNSYL